MYAEFTILGEPSGKGRPRFSMVAGHVSARTPKETVLYENLVRTEYRRQTNDLKFPDGAALRMEVIAYYTIPASCSKKEYARKISGEVLPIKKPDADNVMKVIADSLNKIAYRDDSQIVVAIVKKFYAAQPRVEVRIQTIYTEGK